MPKETITTTTKSYLTKWDRLYESLDAIVVYHESVYQRKDKLKKKYTPSKLINITNSIVHTQ